MIDREDYIKKKADLVRDFQSHHDVSVFLKKHAALLKEILVNRATELIDANSVAVFAAGGFAREELFPYSDIDLLLVVSRDIPDTEKERITEFLTNLWDLGLTVGASVRTPEEVGKDALTDISFATNFLESSPIFGSKALALEAQSVFKESFDAKKFFQEKKLERLQRCHKHGDTPYELEPDVKESIGALRDIHFIRWEARAAGFGSTLDDFERNGLITRSEAEKLKNAMRFLSTLRMHLHLMSRREENRLLFEKQTSLATALGFEASTGLDAAELLMKHYYRKAHEVELLTEITQRDIEERLFEEEVPERGHLEVKTPTFTLDAALTTENDDQLLKNPQNLVDLFIDITKNTKYRELTSHLMRLLYRVALECPNSYFESLYPNGVRRLFHEIFSAHYGLTRALSLMNRWGILGRLIPEFGRIVGQMQHDLFHVYTVDEHTMQAIRNIRRFTHSSYAHEFPHCSQVMAEFKARSLLTLAALLHDIGKGQGGHHAAIGAEIAQGFCRAIGLEAKETLFVKFLVEEHLTMNHIAQKKDLTDEKVIEHFAHVVQTKERLDALYLLTVADIRATNPKLWSAWKGQLLEELYDKTRSFLAGKNTTQTSESAIKEKIEAVKEHLISQNFNQKRIDAFIHELDLTYFMRHSTEDILWHAKVLLNESEAALPLISLRQKENGLIEVFLYLNDASGLVAKILRVFERDGLSVLEARIHTTHSGKVLDTFLAEDKRFGATDEHLSTRLIEHLRVSLTSEEPPSEPRSGKLSRRSRSFPVKPVVDIETDASGRGSLLQISCNDRMGLLYAITYALARHNVNLISAKITTLGERVEDVFLIDGEALRDEESVVALESELLEVLADAD